VYTRVYVHIGKHGHLCTEGLNREKYIKLEVAVRSFVNSKPFSSPKQAASDIAQGYIQQLVMVEEDVTPTDMLEGPSLLQMLEELPPLSDGPRMRTFHTKYQAEEQRICILEIKMRCKYSLIQMKKFLGQDFDGTSYVFKMSSSGLRSGVELVRHMTEGDLKHAYVHFDHIKRVHHWTTLGAHVYDPYCQHVLTIAVCNMKIETGEA
jgi:hypothetical protein